MKDLLIHGLVTGASIPAAYFILRLIFKKSIVFGAGFAMMSFAIVVSFVSFYAGKLGIKADYWVIPLQYILGISVLLYVDFLLRKPLQKSIKQVKEISEGNLTLNIKTTDSKNELGVLNNALQKMIMNITDVIINVKDNTDNVLNASQQMSSASTQLAEGANEQASSIEEISSTMEEITSNIEQNTDNAQETSKVAKDANNSIQSVSEKTKEAIDANKNISEKISIINEIAFQTNILALNAAVEAARAGEHGKGFAVVASEVRKLAERSRVAADEIVSQSELGLEITHNAGNVMSEIIPKIDNTYKLVQEISASSLEQKNGAVQVNTAIQQMNSVTQQNAASSEELASNAKQLFSQAEQLKDVITYFKLSSKKDESLLYEEDMQTENEFEENL